MVSQDLQDTFTWQEASTDLSRSEIRYRQAAPHSERPRAPEQQPEARPRGLGMSPWFPFSVPFYPNPFLPVY